MPVYNSLVKPLLFKLDAERAHHLVFDNLRRAAQVPGAIAIQAATTLRATPDCRQRTAMPELHIPPVRFIVSPPLRRTTANGNAPALSCFQNMTYRRRRHYPRIFGAEVGLSQPHGSRTYRPSRLLGYARAKSVMGDNHRNEHEQDRPEAQ